MYNVEPVISLESYNYLEPYFKKIKYRVAERDICGYEEYYKAFLRYLDVRMLQVRTLNMILGLQTFNFFFALVV